MSDDYLHDKTGKDDEVESLERLLSPLAWKPGTFSPGDGAAESRAAPRPARPIRWPLAVFAIVSTGAAAAGLYVAFGLSHPDVSPDENGGKVVSTKEPGDEGKQGTQGNPEKERVLAGTDPFRLESGETIRTAERVTLVLGDRIGTLVAEKDARLRVLALTRDLQKVRLDRGTVHARIGANVHPGLFQVETPASTCVDLGCHYTLSVDETGAALVHVETGRVAFVDRGGREVFVPAGAHCRAVPSRGSGTPLFDDSTDELAKAVTAFDAAPPSGRLAAGQAVVACAKRPRDTLPLWHFLQEKDDALVDLATKAIVALVPSLPGPEKVDGEFARTPGVVAAWKEFLHQGWWRDY